jgi:general secretion pathway protein A
VHQYSQGLPRQINVLCDHALLTGYVGNHPQISGDIIHECAGELSITQIPGLHRNRIDTPPPGPEKNAGVAAGPRDPNLPDPNPPDPAPPLKQGPDPGTALASGAASAPGNTPESRKTPDSDPLSVRNRPASRSLQNKTPQPDLAETPPLTPAKSSRRGYLILVALALILAGAAASLFLL